jgi:hypothetical protein
MEQDRSARDLEREKEVADVKEASAARPAKAEERDKAVGEKAARVQDKDKVKGKGNAEKTNQKHLKFHPYFCG